METSLILLLTPAQTVEVQPWNSHQQALHRSFPSIFFQHRGMFLCAMSKDLVNEWREAATLSMTLGVFHCPWHVLLAYGSVRMGTAQLWCKQIAVPAMPEDSATMGQDFPRKTGAGLLQGCHFQCGTSPQQATVPITPACLPATLSPCQQ